MHNIPTDSELKELLDSHRLKLVVFHSSLTHCRNESKIIPLNTNILQVENHNVTCIFLCMTIQGTFQNNGLKKRLLKSNQNSYQLASSLVHMTSTGRD